MQDKGGLWDNERALRKPSKKSSMMLCLVVGGSLRGTEAKAWLEVGVPRAQQSPASRSDTCSVVPENCSAQTS